jgi:hypothetical protein
MKTMYTSIPQKPASISDQFRWLALASSIVLFVGWISLLAQELTRDSRVTTNEAIQGAFLALTFVGYAVAWRKELAGALIALFGTIMFFVVCVVGFGKLPGLAVAWFTLPSVLYISAWYARSKYGRLIL